MVGAVLRHRLEAPVHVRRVIPHGGLRAFWRLLDEHPTPIIGVPDSPDVADIFEPVQHRRDRAGREVAGRGEVAGGDGPQPGDDLEDSVVGAVDAHAPGDDLVHGVDRARVLAERRHQIEK